MDKLKFLTEAQLLQEIERRTSELHKLMEIYSGSDAGRMASVKSGIEQGLSFIWICRMQIEQKRQRAVEMQEKD